MAETIFELGRYIAFLGVFFFLIFGIGFVLFRNALGRRDLSISKESDEHDSDDDRKAVDLAEVVHYLRGRAYIEAEPDLRRLGAQYRNRIVWPFYLGVWSFCLGLLLMSLTFGFVLFE